jgi:hypothetical protein
MRRSPNKNGFRTPDGYFKNLPGRLLDRIQKEEPRKTIEKTGFQVPEGYFDTFSDRLAGRLAEKEVPVRNLWSSPLVRITAAAAVIAFLLLLVPSREEVGLQFEDLSGDTIAEYLQSDAVDLSSYELAESLPLGEIAMEDVMEKMPEQNIIDYLEDYSDSNDEIYLDRDE